MSRKRVIALILALTLCIMCVSALTSCSSKEVMSMGESSISLYEIEFFMSRMKGELYMYGYDVGSSSWWGTITSLDGMTMDDFYKVRVLKMASQYMTAQYIFDAEGLSLTDEEKNEVGKAIEKHIGDAGSKNKLNEILSDYGINVKMLEEIYLGELKLQKVKEHLFGSDGLKGDGSEQKKQEYMEETFVCFKQVFLATYYYKCVEDKNGDTVYYTSDKYNEIAYDRINGSPKTDVYNGEKLEADEFGNTVYYAHNGKIAYDTVNGYTKYALDEKGNKIVEYYDNAKKQEILEQAEELASANKTVEEFEKMITEHSDGDSARVYLRVEEGYYEYLDSVTAYLDEIASSLTKMKDGECRVVSSGAGYHIIYKYEHEDKAYENKEYESSFDGFDEEFTSMLFEEKCLDYEDIISTDEKMLEQLPSMKDVGVNVYY